MNKKTFIDTLYMNSQGFLELRALGGHGKPWQEFAVLDAYSQINSFAVNATLQNKNVYFGVSTRDGKGGKKENLVNIPAVWVDIDFKHTPKEAALKALRNFPFKASIIVSTGGGVHVYWVLREPLSPMDDATAIPRVEDVNRRIAAYLDGDHASVDATRILRIPETSNFKYEGPRPVKITYMEHWQYDLDPFLEILPEVNVAPEPSTNGQGKSDYTKENTTALMKCDFIRWCADHPADVKEPLWYALISNLASVRPGGVSLCHDLSKGHPGYSPEETNQKILHALEESRPISCATIRVHGFDCKKKCAVTSPAALVFEIDDGVQGDVKFAQISFIQRERNDCKMALTGGPNAD